jgi:hypothetical protein
MQGTSNMSKLSIEQLEQRLDSFNSADREKALGELIKRVKDGKITLPQSTLQVNMHFHTFFSYNCMGYSPSKIAWLARKNGLEVAAVVDFDVLDAHDEFLSTAKKLGLKGSAGLETRVFVPEFNNKIINSPGELGIAYIIGIGFPKANLKKLQQEFLNNLRETAQKRNRELMERVNKYLKPVELNYQKDVLGLTPSGNPTERHICYAYAIRAKEIFGTPPRFASQSEAVGCRTPALADFWSQKLGVDTRILELPQGRSLLDAIRVKTMKKGGAGYIAPDSGSFPLMADTNKFFLEAGAVPVVAWLDGTSDGEKEMERLLQVAITSGAAALNIIPDRNYKPGVKDEKLKNLYEVVKLAERLNLPVIAGTEMNSPGQKFVDSFQTQELLPLLPTFIKGAYIIYAHSVLQQQCGLGLTSTWARETFKNAKERNEFFQKLGCLLEPQRQDECHEFNESSKPLQILNKFE